MNPRLIAQGVSFVGAVDWDRRLFDALIPLPDGTTYNAYLVQGADKTALIDTVDPAFEDRLFEQIGGVGRLDYLVANHAEQDHAGTIGRVMERHPEVTVLCTPKCKALLIDELHIDEGRVQTVDDGDTVGLGGKTLEFIHLPWVHWPETMVTYLPEDKVLFSCDLFGSHLATNWLYVEDEARVYEAAKRYYAEIMMPFRKLIQKHLEKLAKYDIAKICPSHGPFHDRPAFILDAYKAWASDDPQNTVVVPFVSMHDSTRQMVDHLVDTLTDRGIGVERFNLADVDLGKLAIALVDAETVVIGTPTVLAGPHPAAVYAAYLTAALRPKARFASVIGSYGWGGKTVELIANLIAKLKLEIIPPVLIKGTPRAEDFEALDGLADAIVERHKGAGLL